MISFWGSIFSGIIAGGLTYLGVAITLRFQRKNEIPSKLIKLNEITQILLEYERKIDDSIKNIKNQTNLQGSVVDFINKNIIFVFQDFNKLKEEIIIKSASVNGKTYSKVRRLLEVISLNSYSEANSIGSYFVNNPNDKSKEKLISGLNSYLNDIKGLRKQITFYTVSLEKKFK
jgi:hypothetical protein